MFIEKCLNIYCHYKSYMKLIKIEKGLEISEGSTTFIFTVENNDGTISKGSFTGSEETLIELFKTLGSENLNTKY